MQTPAPASFFLAHLRSCYILVPPHTHTCPQQLLSHWCPRAVPSSHSLHLQAPLLSLHHWACRAIPSSSHLMAPLGCFRLPQSLPMQPCLCAPVQPPGHWASCPVPCSCHLLTLAFPLPSLGPHADPSSHHLLSRAPPLPLHHWAPTRSSVVAISSVNLHCCLFFGAPARPLAGAGLFLRHPHCCRDIKSPGIPQRLLPPFSATPAAAAS